MVVVGVMYCVSDCVIGRPSANELGVVAPVCKLTDYLTRGLSFVYIRKDWFDVLKC